MLQPPRRQEKYTMRLLQDYVQMRFSCPIPLFFLGLEYLNGWKHINKGEFQILSLSLLDLFMEKLYISTNHVQLKLTRV